MSYVILSSSVVHINVFIRLLKFNLMQISWTISQSERRAVSGYLYRSFVYRRGSCAENFDQLRNLQPPIASTTFIFYMQNPKFFYTRVLFMHHFCFQKITIVFCFCSFVACVLVIAFSDCAINSHGLLLPPDRRVSGREVPLDRLTSF